jgi:hypothetical protein
MFLWKRGEEAIAGKFTNLRKWPGDGFDEPGLIEQLLCELITGHEDSFFREEETDNGT